MMFGYTRTTMLIDLAADHDIASFAFCWHWREPRT
jgi:hypothetical protein